MVFFYFKCMKITINYIASTVTIASFRYAMNIFDAGGLLCVFDFVWVLGFYVGFFFFFQSMHKSNK